MDKFLVLKIIRSLYRLQYSAIIRSALFLSHQPLLPFPNSKISLTLKANGMSRSKSTFFSLTIFYSNFLRWFRLIHSFKENFIFRFYTKIFLFLGFVRNSEIFSLMALWMIDSNVIQQASIQSFNFALNG